MRNRTYLVGFNIFGHSSCRCSSNRLHSHKYKDCILTPRFCVYLERRKFTGFPWVDSLKPKDLSRHFGEKIWLKYEPRNVPNLQRAYHKVIQVVQILKRSVRTEGALVHSSHSTGELFSTEDIKLFLEQLKVNFKLFLLKLWSVENHWREQLRKSITISTWKFFFPPPFSNVRSLFEQKNLVGQSKASRRITSRNKKKHFHSEYPTLPGSTCLKSQRQHIIDNSVSSTMITHSKRFPITYFRKLALKPVWFERIHDSIHRHLLSNFVTNSLATLWTEPTFKVHSLLYWQMESFLEQDSLRHRIHFRWKYYPKSLRKNRVVKGTHLSISRWNKIALTFSIVVLRSATDTLWFILRPVVIEGYHILYNSMKRAVDLLFTERNVQIQSTLNKGGLQTAVAKKFRNRTHLENSMKEIILSNFTTFWKLERALSRVSRKTILWGVIEEGSLAKNTNGIWRQSHVDRSEFFTTTNNNYEKGDHSLLGLVPVRILELTGVGFMLFLLGSFPVLSTSLVDIFTFLFQLVAIYLFGTFTFASWRIISESAYFGRLHEAIQGYVSILLRNPLITMTNGNEVVDIVAWQVNDKDELETYSLCKYVEEFWEEGICRAEVILRRIPLVLKSSVVMGWQLLSLFEREEGEKGH
ncbi:hypothetical protein GpartN1_g4111.t1 [Galdieria partita]|uniref:Uncharacterized protein n=1 Tax=Galdieria partita TaxID=83374 RepID=A0A9C7PXP1_9RHOD|nr:hypothetical protein GpartN1_g4111.t1 [Galdieria partita]